MNRVLTTSALLFLSAALASATALAAQGAPGMTQPLRGVLEGVQADQVEVKTRDGADVTIKVTPQTVIRSVALARPEDIKPGSYVGTAAIPQADGTLTALEVHVFSADLRGSGEGHRPWSGADGATGTMTNGTVGNLVVSDGRRMTVKYGAEEKTVVVPENVPIVTLEAGDATLLQAGAKVILFPTQGPDGSVAARSISVGKDGITPPM